MPWGTKRPGRQADRSTAVMVSILSRLESGPVAVDELCGGSLQHADALKAMVGRGLVTLDDEGTDRVGATVTPAGLSVLRNPLYAVFRR